MTAQPFAPPARRPAFLLYLLPLLFVGAYWLVRGYLFGVVDDGHAIQIPFLKATLDPTLYPGDPMIATRSGYPAFYFDLLALLVRRIDLPTVFLGLHILTLAGFLLGIVVLTRSLVHDTQPIRPVVVVLLLSLAALPVLSGDDLIVRSTLARHTAMVLGLWVLILGVRGSQLAAYTLAGLLFNLHALTGGYVLTMLVLADIASLPRQRWREIGLLTVLALILASPALVWILRTSEAVTSEWITLLRVRSAQHSFPFSWPPVDYVMFGLWLLLAALGWWPLRRTTQGRWLAGAALAVAGLGVIGIVFSEVVPLGPVLRAQLLRSTKFLTLLGLPLVTGWLLAQWDRAGLVRLGGLIVGAGLFLPDPWLWSAVVGIGLLIVLLAGWPPLARAGQSFEQRAASGLPAPVKRVWNRFVHWPGVVRWSAVLLLVVGGLALVANLSRTQPAADALAAWVDVQAWAHDNTARDAIFLTPAYLYGFRVESERPIVGEWKDGTQQYFSVPYASDWWNRMRDLKTESGRATTYNDLTQAEVEAIRDKYGARYAVFFADKALDLPVAYRNPWFVVYLIPDR